MGPTNRETSEFLRKFSNKLCEKNGFSKCVSVDDIDEFTGNGVTESYFDIVYSASVGIKELFDNPDARTDNYTFMKVFVSVLHEYTHIYQRERLLHEKGSTSNFIALSYLAGSASEIYYNDSCNYKYMSDEIAAQYSALKNGYNILSQFVGKKKANSMICDYVNKHINDEFVENSGKDYLKVDDIFDDYEKAFKKSRTAKRNFDRKEYNNVLDKFCQKHPDKNDEQIMNSITDIPLKCLIKEKLSGKPSSFINAMENSKLGIYQDFVLAQAYLNSCKENKQKYKELRALSSINFTFKIPSLKKTLEQIRFLNLSNVTPEFSFSAENLSDDYDFDNFDM